MIESEIAEQIRKLTEAASCLMVEIESAKLTTREALKILEELKGGEDGRTNETN